MSLLQIEGVSVEFPKGNTKFKALDGVSLTVNPGETVAVVGESGCGKTTLARAVLGLQLYSGEIHLGGRRVEGVHPGQAQDVGIVWQDPYASLDPRWKVGRSVEEPGGLVGKRLEAGSLMSKVGLDPSFASRYPHQMSGGQRQRVAIARALALGPKLLICDEPTAALDLSVQAQVLNLLKDLQKETGAAYLYISHDLLTVHYLADRIAVMYLGQIVEEGPTEEVFKNPKHPYTEMLLSSMLSHERVGQLPHFDATEIGSRPEQGCLFAPRCDRKSANCMEQVPPLNAGVACHHPLEGLGHSPAAD